MPENILGSLQIYSPAIISFCIAAGVSWFDIQKSSEKDAKFIVYPHYYGSGLLFILSNGAVAALFFILATSKDPTILTLLTLRFQDPWLQAVAVGLVSIAIVRSRLFPLKDNKAFGVDIIYTTWRDHVVSQLVIFTSARREDVINEYIDAFLGEDKFVKHFKEIVFSILKQKGSKTDISNLNSAIELLNKDPENKDEYRKDLQEILIKTALSFGNIYTIEEMLRSYKASRRFHRRGQILYI